MTIDYWKEKFQDKPPSELEEITTSSRYQEAARIAASELLGIDSNSEIAQPEFVTKKNDLKFLLERLDDHGFLVNFKSDKNFDLKVKSSDKIIALIFFYLGVLVLSAFLVPSVLHLIETGEIIIYGRPWKLIAIAGLTLTAWYRYFSAHALKISYCLDQLNIEGYNEDGEKTKHQIASKEIERFETEKIDAWRIGEQREHLINCVLRNGSRILMIRVNEKMSTATDSFVSYLADALTENIVTKQHFAQL